MAKRSTNFTGRKPIKASHVLSLMEWVGMTEEEIRAVADSRKTPLFVNINGEDTVPATINAGVISYAVGKRQYSARYRSADIHPVTSDGETWYEINDTALEEVDE